MEDFWGVAKVRIFDQLSVRLMLCLTLIIAGVSVLSFIWTIERLKYRAEGELRDKARVAATQFLAIRSFIAESYSFGCPSAGDDSDGSANQFQHLDPAAAEKGVRDLFGGDERWSFKEIWFPGDSPENIPDAFEIKLIDEMSLHPEIEEAWGVDMVEGQKVFRYLLPIWVEEPCLSCHDEAGSLQFQKEIPQYEIGDLAGAVSLSIPMTIFQDYMQLETRAQMAATVALILLAVATVFLVIRSLVDRPLTSLAEAAEEIGKGKLDHPLPRISVPVEIGALAQQLHSMALRLKDSYSDLEYQVAMRTRELITANETLKKQQEELQEANRQLARANRLKSEFLASVSHELRTPLTSIIAFVELLLEGTAGELTGQQKEYLEDVLRGSQRLMTSINAILDMAKIEARKMTLKNSSFSLAELIREIEHRMDPVALKKNLELEVDLEGELVVYADKQKIEQVIVNLVGNAIKFTPAGGKVTITARQKEKEILVWVADTGIGIKEEDQEYIFEAFRQVDGSSTRSHQGTGLGLALAKNLVEMHGGTIWVESRPGLGSTFYFTIPLAQKETEVTDCGR
jgi:two-component system sensor histidine kinase BarA